MNKHWPALITLLALLAANTVMAGDTDLRAAVAVGVQSSGEIWAGQQVTLNLDLKTTGFSFSGSTFNLPEIPGAFLVQTDTATVKLSEQNEGRSWQIIRYPLSLYPLRQGKLTVPAIDVRFSTSAGFGKEQKDFRFQTRPLELTVTLPPGVKDGDLVVSTSSFELVYDWQPVTATASTGDAVTLTVRRRAADISAMLLPPLPAFSTEGLAVYPQAPEVTDRSYRGNLTGERLDTITWVFEQPGSYEIPGIRFQWWDPEGRVLKQAVVGGLNVEAGSPATNDQRTASEPGLSGGFNLFMIGWLLAGLFIMLVIILWWRKLRGMPGRQADSERSAFSALKKACREHHPARCHAALHTWLGLVYPRYFNLPGPVTLGAFANAMNNAELATELTRLQEALTDPETPWQGNGLFRCLRRGRNILPTLAADPAGPGLTPLNPRQIQPAP